MARTLERLMAVPPVWTMGRKIKPSFVLELLVRTASADERALATHLDAARNVDNAWCGEALPVDASQARPRWSDVEAPLRATSRAVSHAPNSQ
jgi:hypothetical protein